ncbi:MAG: hypothetical protein ACLU3N_09175 [Lachnospiraceae bacterium]
MNFTDKPFERMMRQRPGTDSGHLASTAATNGSAAICATSAARSSARCWAIPHRLQPGQSAPDAAAIDGR